MTAAAALRAAKLKPITLAPKEGLALMNGTAVMTGLACLAYARAEHLVRAATRITAMISYATEGNPAHFDRRLFAVKPHAGQQAVAAWLRADLGALRGLCHVHFAFSLNAYSSELNFFWRLAKDEVRKKKCSAGESRCL